MQPVQLSTGRLIIVPLREDSALQVLDFYKRNQGFFAPWTPEREEDFYTLERQRERLAFEAREMENGTRIKFWFLRRDNGKLIGFVDFWDIIRGALQSCTLGYCLDHEENGNGYMSEALHVAIRHVLDEERLHRIEANIMPRNRRSLRLARRLGFKREGMARRYLKINGKWENHVRMTLLNE